MLMRPYNKNMANATFCLCEFFPGPKSRIRQEPSVIVFVNPVKNAPLHIQILPRPFVFVT